MHAENARQWVHVGMSAFALLLRALTWWQAAACAGAALAFNVFVLPRIGGRRLYRPADEARGFPLGIVLYPLAVLLLILAFPHRLDIAAAGWGILAFGDGAATLVGRRIGGPRWPWNHEKTVAGTTAFIVCGGAAGVMLAWWTRPAIVPMPPLAFTIAAPLAASVAAAMIETMATRLDDNVSVPAVAAAIMWLATYMTVAAWHASWPFVASMLPWAIVANGIVAAAGYRAKTVSVSGAVAGAVVGSAMFAFGGWPAWTMLLATFVVASAASKLGMERKVLLGIAEDRGGRRGAGNALANCGVAVAAALAAVTTPDAAAARLALVTALAAGGSDTVASEIGKAWGRATFLVTSLGRVKPGTSGAMSLEGTAAGIIAALALAALAAALGLIPGSVMVAVVIGATAGALAESALGATLEGPGILNNDMLNFINTAVAAFVAVAIA